MRRWPGGHDSLPFILWHTADLSSANAGFDIFDDDQDYEKRPNGFVDASDFIVDIREYDVPYHVRVSIDLGGSIC